VSAHRTAEPPNLAAVSTFNCKGLPLQISLDCGWFFASAPMREQSYPPHLANARMACSNSGTPPGAAAMADRSLRSCANIKAGVSAKQRERAVDTTVPRWGRSTAHGSAGIHRACGAVQPRHCRRFVYDQCQPRRQLALCHLHSRRACAAPRCTCRSRQLQSVVGQTQKCGASATNQRRCT
jgi:hypothetical protein